MADELRAPALDPATVKGEERQPYPAPWDTALTGKFRKVLGDALGLTQIGVNLTRLAPGAISALRHWHTGEDEFVFVVSGEPTLVCDSGEQRLGPGHVAGFPAGSGDGHRLENRTGDDVEFLEIGTRATADRVHYTEDDLILDKTVAAPARRFTRRDGTPY
ncbi:MAG: cupin domain-containing protein [Defluviicoccus sp.]|nr:cupin domain-containing protein [Defluviicoccus sp.]MDE0382457.1 cupin domain-containing protein [Defluviicoccus sp.]